MWQTIEPAPKGEYKQRIITREDGKQITRDDFVSPQVLLVLDGKAYLTKALPCGRWNGLSEKDKPSHWMEVPEIPPNKTSATTSAETGQHHEI